MLRSFTRLQTLRECVYQASTKTCTCFAGIMDPRSIDHDATLRYVFAAAPNCEVIHGTIYSCLRAMFGLSVIGILVSIFSCMLVYQILSHEKKKAYLAELNSRCRTLYQRPGLSQSHYSRAGRYAENSQLCHYPWELNNRLCTGMGGNLYTPTPENSISTISTMINTTPTQSMNSRVQECGDTTFANWRWLPWNRKTVTTNNSQLIHSQSDSLGVVQRADTTARPPHWRYSHSDAIYGFRPPPLQQSRDTMSSYSMTGQYGRAVPGMDLGQIDSLSNLLWGPPPPYSHPPSTADTSDHHTPSPVTASSESPQRSQSRMSRTTKSGILVECKEIDGGKKSGSSESPIHYDETVDSAMHIYEKLRRSRSGSLPSRRVKKDKKPMCRVSSTNIIDESAPTRQLNQNLSALNLSRAEELRTAKDLEEIKRALIALQQNSLGIFQNIQYDNQLYLKGNSAAQGEALQKIEYSSPSQAGLVLKNINQVLNNPATARNKPHGVYSVSNEQLGQPRSQQPKFSLPSVQRKTISTQNLITSGTDSDNSYGVSSVPSMSAGSRGSSNLSSPGPSSSTSPYILNQVVQNNPQGIQTKYGPISPKFVMPLPSNPPEERQVIKTQELPHINSSIIQTANKKLLCLQNNNHHMYGKLPLSLSGLISPRHNSKDRQEHTNAVTGVRESALKSDNGSVHPSVGKPFTKPVNMSDQSDRLLSGLISPTRMYPSNFSPSTNQPAPPVERRKSGFVYLRPEQNIPESFCDKFRPIAPAGEANTKYSENKNDFIDVKNVSSDDIVVTLHSVNV